VGVGGRVKNIAEELNEKCSSCFLIKLLIKKLKIKDEECVPGAPIDIILLIPD